MPAPRITRKNSTAVLLSLVSNMALSTPCVRATTGAEIRLDAVLPAAKRLATLVVEEIIEAGILADAAACASRAANAPAESVRPCADNLLASSRRPCAKRVASVPCGQ